MTKATKLKTSLNTTLIISTILLLSLGMLTINSINTPDAHFDGERAMGDVDRQVSFGPRTPGSDAHAHTIDYIYDVLDEHGWAVQIQESSLLDKPIRNVIGQRGDGQPWIIHGCPS